MFEINKLVNSTKHHLFGFHDLVISNFDDTKTLSLEVKTISHPPFPGETVSVGYVFEHEFIKLGDTNAFNYPQGARMQWYAKSNNFTVNIQNGKQWGAALYDTDVNKLVEKYDSTIHVLTKDGNWGFGLDYERIHRLGGYGYIGLPDPFELDNAPSQQGIWLLNTQTKEKKLLVSIKEVSECDKMVENVKKYPNYLTHLVLNPSNDRLAFLHRYFLPDGGFITRLMSIGIDGTLLRCLLTGNLSHFDWKDDRSLYIWGRVNSSIDKLRNNSILNNPLFSLLLRNSKNILRTVLNRTTSDLNFSFIKVNDDDLKAKSLFACDTLKEDGHPMTCPINRDWCIIDTYPNMRGDRVLMLYQFSTNRTVQLGIFRMIQERPDRTFENLYTQGIDKNILLKINPELVAFTRSGLHCDLHPRWFHHGKIVAFDSIHEGTRQIYTIDVSEIIGES